MMNLNDTNLNRNTEKQPYEQLELEVIPFETEDVIDASIISNEQNEFPGVHV